MPAFANQIGLYLRVPRGREYLMRVPGASQAPLSDAELALLLNWIVRRYGPTEIAADFEPFSEPEVSSLRRPPLVEPAALREELQTAIAQLRSAGNSEKKAGSSARRSGGK